MNFLLLLKNYWKYIGIGVLLFIIGIEYILICSRNNTIQHLEYAIDQLNTVIQAKENSIVAYKKSTLDYDAKLENVNDQLRYCNNRLLTQTNDLLTIESIMESTDTTEHTETKPVEVKKDVKPISNTTQTKGIDFINQQFDSIK